MKKLFITLVLLTIANYQIFAQEETLVGTGEITHGWFAAPVLKISNVNNGTGVFIGGRGGWIINHTFVLGLGGYGLVTDVKANNLISINNSDAFLALGYGGFELEYIVMSDNLVHFTAYALIGGGSVTYRGELWDDWDDWDFGHDSFFVIEPALNAELNITSFMRLNAGFSYRFFSGLDFDDLKSSDLGGFTTSFTLKFGDF